MDINNNIKYYNHFLNDLDNLIKDIFDEDLPDNLMDIYEYYNVHYGCDYSKEDGQDFLNKFSDKVKIANRNLTLINKFFEENTDFEENIKVKAFGKKLEEKENCNKAVRNIMMDVKKSFN